MFIKVFKKSQSGLNSGLRRLSTAMAWLREVLQSYVCWDTNEEPFDDFNFPFWRPFVSLKWMCCVCAEIYDFVRLFWCICTAVKCALLVHILYQWQSAWIEVKQSEHD